ncbi:MAG TPA: helix-turn-helix transcriptional regulator [Desulfomonilaceae bacterium]|nr:helix-turn-helix transcriptional regulator [Desulfomonilaceae bacterium]
MDVQSVLLGFLMHNSMTGYDLKKAFSMSFSFFSGLSYGSIYPALKKMEKLGLISKTVEIQDGAPNRKVYTITEEGRKVFLESLRTPLMPERHKSSFLMRLFFFAYLAPEERKAIAIQHLNSVEQMRNQLETFGPEIEARADRFQLLCFQFGLRMSRDLARNLSEVVKALE